MTEYFDAQNVKIFVGDKVYTDNIDEGQSHYYVVNSLGVDNPEFPDHTVVCSSTDPEDIVTHVFRPSDVTVVTYGSAKEVHI